VARDCYHSLAADHFLLVLLYRYRPKIYTISIDVSFVHICLSCTLSSPRTVLTSEYTLLSNIHKYLTQCPLLGFFANFSALSTHSLPTSSIPRPNSSSTSPMTLARLSARSPSSPRLRRPMML